MIVYREEHSSIFLNICWLHNIVSTNEVILNVVFVKRAEETSTSKASILKFLLIGQRAQPGLGGGFAHRPAALLRVSCRLEHRSELVREGKARRGAGGLRILGNHVKFSFPAATEVIELLDALVDQGRRGLLVRHRHPATEEHLELLGECVVELRRAVELLLAGDFPGLADGADDLRHLWGEEGALLGVRSSCSHPRTQGLNVQGADTALSCIRSAVRSIARYLKEDTPGNPGP